MQKIPGEFLELDRKERARIPSNEAPIRDASERVCDFDEVAIPIDEQLARFEAARCIHCPDPAPCMLACPAHNDIPSAMWLIEQGKFLEAAEIYRSTSSLPEICARVCPHDELCQGSCVRSKNGEPVQTGLLEAFALDYARKYYETQPVPVPELSGKRVAVVGAGPAGLACAEQLIQKGHEVTMFDSKPAPGGLMVYGIPNFKLSKDVVLKRINDLLLSGVKFEGETYIGKDKTIDELFNEGFDAVFVGVGTGVDAPLKAPGVDLPGVYQATEFLIRANVDLELIPEPIRARPPIGNKVVVIGGGDTASDCLRTALRMGAEEVTCLYRRTENEMPGNKKDRELTKQEGAIYKFLTQPVRFVPGEDGRLAAVECLRMELGEPDSSGRRRPVAVEGSNFMVEADTAILALGYWPDEIIGKTTPDLETHDWGLITANRETGITSRPGVFAGGDAVTGPSLVAIAMVAGRRAATAIDNYLRQNGS